MKEIDELWNSFAKLHKDMKRRRAYYHGESDIRQRNERYASGMKKANVPTNWAGYVVDMYVGAMTDQPYQVAQDEEEVPDTVQTYQRIAKAADLDSADTENLRNALICGYGIELHEFKDNAPRVLVEKPEAWALLRDENDIIQLAVTRLLITKGGLFRGEVMTDDTEIQYTYDATKRQVHRRKLTKAGSGEWLEVETQPHYYGAVPVVETYTNDDRRPLLSDALLEQIDEYEQIDSLSGDDIRNTADALLVLKGIDPAWVKANAEMITSQRVLPIAQDASAEYLIRVTDTERIDARLNRTREAIHIMGNVPDIQQIVGATGGTSGIALQLKFMPMQQRAGAWSKFVMLSVRERINLLNSIIGKAAQETIENYKVIIGFSMPINRIEEWQYIGSLTDIVSHKTQLELLSDIDDADRELDNVRSDMAAAAEVRVLTEGPEVQAARQDVQVAQAAPKMDAQIQTSLDLIGDRILAAVTRTQ